MQKCLFLDRDGTINKFGIGYNFKEEHVTLIKGVDKMIAEFIGAGYKIIVITNQGGIGKGVYTEQQMNAVNEHIDRLLRKNGAHIDAFYYCPHYSKTGTVCACRKPGTLLLENACKDFNADINASLFVGDNYTDMLCAKNFGVRFYPFEFRHVYSTTQGFRIVINEYSENLIEKMLEYAESAFTNGKSAYPERN